MFYGTFYQILPPQERGQQGGRGVDQILIPGSVLVIPGFNMGAVHAVFHLSVKDLPMY